MRSRRNSGKTTKVAGVFVVFICLLLLALNISNFADEKVRRTTSGAHSARSFHVGAPKPAADLVAQWQKMVDEAAVAPSQGSVVVLGDEDDAMPTLAADSIRVSESVELNFSVQDIDAGPVDSMICGEHGMLALSRVLSSLHQFSAGNAPENVSQFGLCVYFESDVISSFFLRDGFWRDCRYIPDLLFRSKTNANDVPLLVDVGANIGSCSAEAAALGYRVIAIEPINSSFVLLNHTKSFNNFIKLQVVHSGVGFSANDSVPSWKQRVLVERGNFGNAVMTANEEVVGKEEQWENTEFLSQIVNMRRLDDVVREHVHVLKLDVQGYEVKVLRGASGLFSQHGVDFIRSELDPKLLSLVGDDGVTLLNLLDSYGFAIHVADEGRGQEFSTPLYLPPKFFSEFVNDLEHRNLAVHFNATRKALLESLHGVWKPTTEESAGMVSSFLAAWNRFVDFGQK